MAQPDDELGTLLEQLDEVLLEPIVDGDDAFEVLVLAALAARLGATEGPVAQVAEMRDGDVELVDAAFEALDLEALAEAVEAVLTGDADPDDVEEAILDVDEAVVCALWCGRPEVVKRLALRVEDAIRKVPEVFSSLAEDGAEMARLPDAARWPELYGFWLAVADSAQWADT